MVIQKILKLFSKNNTKKVLSTENALKKAEKELNSQTKEIEKKIFFKTAEIKHLSKQTAELVKELEKEEYDEQAFKKFKKIVEGSKKHTVIQLKKLIQKITPTTVQSLNETKKNSEKALLKLHESITKQWKNIAYTGTGHNTTMKKIGKNIEEITGLYKEIIECTENPKIIATKNIVAMLKELHCLPEKKRTTKKKLSEIKQKNLETQQKIRELNQKIMQIENSAEIKNMRQRKKEIEKLEKEIKSIHDKLYTETSFMEKPLKKIKKLLEEKRVEEKNLNLKKVNEFFENRIGLLKAEPKGEIFKKLASETIKQVKNNAIQVKQKQKLLLKLKGILQKDFFSQYFWEENTAKKTLEQLKKASQDKKILLELQKTKEKTEKEKQELLNLKKEEELTKKLLQKQENKKKELKQKITKEWKKAFNQETKIK